MGGTRFLTVVLVVFLAISGATAPVVAQDSGDGGEASEKGSSGLSSIFIFISGAALLVYSAEKLIGYLVETASGLNISVFTLAIIFTGIEFDDIFLGVVLGLEGLSGVALGIVFGTTLSLTGVTLAVAAIITPFEVDIQRDYLALFAVAPCVLVPFMVGGSGTFSALDGVLLVGLFVGFLAYIVYREGERDTEVFRHAEVHEILDGGVERPLATDLPFATNRDLSGVIGLALAILALVGLVIGAATTGMGTEGIISAYRLEGTIFGATIATAVLTIEDILLTVEPVRRGAPEIGVGNVIGSVIFSVTGKLGVIALAGSITVGGLAFSWHLPAFLFLTLLAAYFINTGRLKPTHGYTLLGLYVIYWVVSFVFGVLPAEI